MEKLLYVAPHLSTGGLPQYLLKKIQTFQNTFDIYLVEWDNITGNELVVQKNKIFELIPSNKRLTLGEDKTQFLEFLDKVKPDIIHFEEIPEHFIKHEILDKVYYKEDREYYIAVTTHSSTTKPGELNYLADKFILVSQWSLKVFENFFGDHIECDIWEYPIENQPYDKLEAKNKLNFDPNFKHVLHVGLFAPGKNQAEIIDLAKLCLNEPIIFHFVGNQAGNFEDYWKPLMKDFPKNCVWHGEQSNIEDYYKASDVFYFPSLWELNPIVLKEAVSYGLPLFIKKLNTYENYYDGLAKYISSNQKNNQYNLYKTLGISQHNTPHSKHEIGLYHILTDIDTLREVGSMKSLSPLATFGINYTPVISPRYTQLPPKDTCKYPEKINLLPGDALTPGHYGCYLGHKKAFYEGISSNNDFILICEADCAIDIPYKEFMEKLEFACETLNKSDELLMFSFGFHNNNNILEKREKYFIVNKFYGAHAYLIPKRSFEIINNMYETCKWNVTDLMFAEELEQYKTGIFEIPITKQLGGYSILDQIEHEDRY